MLNNVLPRDQVEIDEVGWKVMLRDKDGKLYSEWGYDPVFDLQIQEDTPLVSPRGPGFHVLLSKDSVLSYYRRNYLLPYKSLSIAFRRAELGENRVVIKKVYMSVIRGVGDTNWGEKLVVAANLYIPSLGSLKAKVNRKELVV